MSSATFGVKDVPRVGKHRLWQRIVSTEQQLWHMLLSHPLPLLHAAGRTVPGAVKQARSIHTLRCQGNYYDEICFFET